MWYTSKGVDVYAIALRWTQQLTLGCVEATHGMVFTLLGVDGQLEWTEEKTAGGVKVGGPKLYCKFNFI